ncbi:MAG: 2'-deoxycytidine 5'-triphosphate deaminase, partial [Pseudomonadota bacterium]
MADEKRGVLPDHELFKLFEHGAIKSQDDLDETQIQPASLDLRLAFDAYR